MAGALAGLRIVEFVGIGPGPFAAMMLADHGAEVIRIDRPGADHSGDILARSRIVVELDLKTAEGLAEAKRLIARAHGLIEGFRPGVMERLGLGPDVLLEENPALVYGRMTGWGQEGPFAALAGHDINYISMTGNLHSYGRAGGPPTPAINAVGDFGGGGMMLAFGMLAGILHARDTGRGQVVDCAMTDGAALLAGMTWTFLNAGTWRDERGVNLLDTGAPFYDVYETADRRHIAVGAIETPFFRELLRRLGLADDPEFADHRNQANWPAIRARFTAIFKTRTRDEWDALLGGGDACVTPVLSMAEAPRHPNNVARGAFLTLDGVVQPAPAPRFSATPAPEPVMPARASKGHAA